MMSKAQRCLVSYIVRHIVRCGAPWRSPYYMPHGAEYYPYRRRDWTGEVTDHGETYQWQILDAEMYVYLNPVRDY